MKNDLYLVIVQTTQEFLALFNINSHFSILDGTNILVQEKKNPMWTGFKFIKLNPPVTNK
jgi:hypothetical protein